MSHFPPEFSLPRCATAKSDARSNRNLSQVLLEFAYWGINLAVMLTDRPNLSRKLKFRLVLSVEIRFWFPSAATGTPFSLNTLFKSVRFHRNFSCSWKTERFRVIADYHFYTTTGFLDKALEVQRMIHGLNISFTLLHLTWNNTWLQHLKFERMIWKLFHTSGNEINIIPWNVRNCI